MSREERGNDIREYMNIEHFEQLQSLFENNVNEDGSQGFDLEMVHVVSNDSLLKCFIKSSVVIYRILS
jgi:hypothetical protein